MNPEKGQVWKYKGPPPGQRGEAHLVLSSDDHQVITWGCTRVFDPRILGHSFLGDMREFLEVFEPA